jgi:hypothetical protein
VQTRQDTLRLRVLTRLNWRRSTCGDARLFGDVKVLKRSVPLRFQTGTSHLTSALRAAQAAPKRFSDYLLSGFYPDSVSQFG